MLIGFRNDNVMSRYSFHHALKLDARQVASLTIPKNLRINENKRPKTKDPFIEVASREKDHYKQQRL